ncbi:PDZ domain-containing protein, partial [bacterium]|nr:PDZ domain-containing protein [bacterium]
ALFHHMVAPEGRHGFALGMTVSPDGPARVTAVVKGSPADAAGIRVDDVVTAVGLEPVSEGLHFTLALVGRKGGDALPLQLQRDGRPAHATVTLAPVVPLAPVDAPGALPGLHYHVYRGRWERLPDFARLKPDSHGTLPAFGLGPAKGQENIGLRIEGYVAVPADGNYAFYLSSDDGSRLSIGDRLVVDHDGLHAADEKRGFVALKAGKHPIRVDFFECSGDEALAVAYEGPGIDKQPIPPTALFRSPATDH